MSPTSLVLSESGTGTLFFIDERDQLRELVGKIIVAQDSLVQDSYVEVESDGKHYLMPTQSVKSIRWDKEPRCNSIESLE